MPESYFVTGSTGAQGGAVARALLDAGQTVHALVRDPSTPAAKALDVAGAKVFRGSFEKVEAMTEAAKGCIGVFLNVSPVFTDPRGEEKHARNVLEACRAAGTIEQIVQSSVSSVGVYAEGKMLGLDQGSPMATYYANKLAVEKAVKQSQVKNWAIVRPPRLLNSYVAPLANFMFPTLKSEGVLATALAPDLRQTVTDPRDVGLVVRDIFLKNKLWDRVISLGGEYLTMAEIVEAMNAALGFEKIKLRFYSAEEAKEFMSKNPIIASELFLNRNGSVFKQEPDTEAVPGFEPGSAVEYFQRDKELLQAGFGERLKQV